MNSPTVLEFKPRVVHLPGELTALCQQYLAHRMLRKQQNTVLSDKTDLEQFVGYLSGRDIRFIQTLSAATITDFIDAMLYGHGLKARTVARKLTTVKSLFRYAITRGLIKRDSNPCDDLEAIKFHQDPVFAPEVARFSALIEAIPKDSVTNIRDRAMFRLILSAGLRVGGMQSLDLFDPDNPPKYFVKSSGLVLYRAKGGEVKNTVCDAKALKYLDEWLAVRHAFERRDTGPALFLSSRGARVSRQGVRLRLIAHGERVGMMGLHPHLLRHSRANQVITTAGLHEANYLLGHAQMSTTANTYGHSMQEKLRQRVLVEVPVDVEEEVAHARA